jgi:hypothetical protein
MTRLPDLERSLHRAAQRLEHAAEPAPGARPTRDRLGRFRLPLLATVATMTLAGGALAANALLQTGEPVPANTSKRWAEAPRILPGMRRVIDVGAKDPRGGPGWAIALYGVELPPVTFPDGRRSTPHRLVCATAARFQGGEIGVVGRDGVFGDDGRFHPLVPESRPSGACVGGDAHGLLGLTADGPTVPASGYTGPPGARGVGGCKEYVADPAATQSKWVRRRLRDVPVCRASGQRIVKYGFAGPRATKVTFGNSRFTRTATPDPETSGAYLFVVLPKEAGEERPVLTTTYDDGLVCRSSLGSGPGDPRCTTPPGFERPSAPEPHAG